MRGLAVAPAVSSNYYYLMWIQTEGTREDAGESRQGPGITLHTPLLRRQKLASFKKRFAFIT